MGYYKSKIEDYSKLKPSLSVYGENNGNIQEIKSIEEVMESIKEDINSQAYIKSVNRIEDIKGDSSLSEEEKHFQVLLQEHEIDSLLKTSAQEYFEMLVVSENYVLSNLQKDLQKSVPQNDSRLLYATEALEEFQSLSNEEVINYVVDRCACEGELGFNQEHFFGYQQVDGLILDPQEKLYFAKQYPLKPEEQFDQSAQNFAMQTMEE